MSGRNRAKEVDNPPWWQPVVAVSGLIWRGEDVLFLHRVQPPRIWVPPGGRVEASEEPHKALRREIMEETGCADVDIVAPCIIAAGRHDGNEILFLDFVCSTKLSTILLAPGEHDAWRWFSFTELVAAEATAGIAAGGEPYSVYYLAGKEVFLSHSVEQLRQALRILRCLRPDRGP